ncbi:RNA 2',3'-cyclic phosphodiesterase [Paenibacillus arenilitoris]|uniref:RNA 2',3'-cyclic phosphodiesterase n=1 Tax=Paenibacillus arenilitoris TaxID=2772299 RepID=A0A927H5V1_9BACL|nr:RNA 2',3'-cyclic phosphodiesterase [Paenibacillus arenilitoris]MBD2868923.1 RNA 2',3'-cyclic phosphodiesterase [Paenibacillus arenilitoris]
MNRSAPNSDTMRLFVAVPIPADIAGELKEWTDRARSRLPFRKWTHPQDYHITLQFLGDTSASAVGALHEALRGVRGGPFPLRLDGAGTFGSPPAAPRVLWAAVIGGRDALTALHLSVAQATLPLGFAKEERPYSPHVTLARGYAGGSVPMPPGAVADAPRGARWEADRFVLMRTHMHASPMYESIGEYTLVKP